MTSDNPNLHRIEDLYVAWTLAEETAPAHRAPLSIGDLVAFLAKGKPLTHAQHRALFTNPRLRADMQRLKEELAYRISGDERTESREAADTRRAFRMPALAAAATDREIDERSFDGASLRVCPSARPGHVFVILQFEDPTNTPSALLVESPEGEMVRMALPAMYLDGEGDSRITLVKDTANAADALLISLLRNPASTGIFLK